MNLPEPKGPLMITGLNPDRCEGTYTAEQVRRAVLDERERCAKVCESLYLGFHSPYEYSDDCAAAIRKG